MIQILVVGVVVGIKLMSKFKNGNSIAIFFFLWYTYYDIIFAEWFYAKEVNNLFVFFNNYHFYSSCLNTGFRNI